MWSPRDTSLPEKLDKNKIIVLEKINSLSKDQTEQEIPSAPLNWICLFNLENAHQKAIRSVCFEPTKGDIFASASFDGGTGIWAKNSSGEYECCTSLEGHENEVKSVNWSPSGQLVATCGRDKTIWIWEAAYFGNFEYDCTSVMMEHTQDVKMILWHPFEEILASASYDDTIRIWKEDDDDWSCVSILKGHSSTVWAIDFDPTGTFLASCSDDLTVKIWTPKANFDSVSKTEPHFTADNSEEWRCVLTIPPEFQSRSIYSISWSFHYRKPKILNIEGESIYVDNGYIATVSADNSICIFSICSKLKNVGNISIDPSSEPFLDNLYRFEIENMEYKLVSKVENAHGYFDINSVRWNNTPGYENWLVTAGDDNNAKVWYFDL
ncbi:hypothetical protein BB560_003990 [Smittium megazygosporum]|uniref:Probable cytosolic iron-sulfur protein assembly protein 1 n=1 Tax=Smittium megazygosporum TaxID=133381 RepID=A0A2T9ZAM0_9FUNG|nr:hypothetical protein BB560_003990 [Smittium megazygosporum]